MTTTQRTQTCEYCDLIMVDNWNLAPIVANDDNTQRTYEHDVYLCDECYDQWCYHHDIQPLATQ